MICDLCDSCMLSHDTRMRCSLVDLYYVLYGKRRPVCIPIPELAALLKPQKVDTFVESEVSIDKESLFSVNQILFCDMHFYSVFLFSPQRVICVKVLDRSWYSTWVSFCVTILYSLWDTGVEKQCMNSWFTVYECIGWLQMARLKMRKHYWGGLGSMPLYGYLKIFSKLSNLNHF